MTNSIFDQTMAEMTFREVEAAAARGVPVLVPLGVIEQHGPHLPLGVDIYGAHTLARLTRQRLANRGVEALISPPFYWGVNTVTAGFTGSFRVRPDTAHRLLVDLCTSLAQDGFTRQFALNHHGDHVHLETVHAALAELRAGGLDVRWVEHEQTVQRLGADPADPLWLVMPGTPGYVEQPPTGLDVHGAGTETVLVARYYPDQVRYDLLPDLPPTSLGAADLSEWREDARRVTPDGYFGTPWPRDPAAWQFYENVADAMTETIAAALSG